MGAQGVTSRSKAQEIAKRETVRYHDVKLIVDRFNTLMRKSGDAIANPQARCDEAYRCWQQENKGDDLKGIP